MRFDAASRRERGLSLFAGGELFVAGLLAMPSFLFDPSLPFRAAQFFLFWFFVWAVGRKNSAIATLSVAAGIVAFNLIVPYGRVLFAWGAFRVTEGSLLGGIEKALTVEGLIMLSKATIRSDLRLPGSFGALIGDSFRYFDRILEKKGSIDRKDITGSIDRLLLELSADQEAAALMAAVAGPAAGPAAGPGADPAAGPAADASADAAPIPAHGENGWAPASARGPGRSRVGRFVLAAAVCTSWTLFAAAWFR